MANKKQKNKKNSKKSEDKLKDKSKAKENLETSSNEETEPKKELTLEEKYEKLVTENNELKDKLLRRVAEFENFRRRSISEKADWIKNANKRLVLELCDINDNFERALHPETEKNRKAFEQGIEMIFKQISEVLKKENVEKIDALGNDFDPELHEALAHIPSDYKEDKVAAVIRNGYKMNDKIIRAARVAVSNGEKPDEKKKKKKNK